MNKTLNMTPEASIFDWSTTIKKTLSEGTDLYIVGDVETTGLNELGDKKNFGKKDRIIEVGLLFYTKNKSGTLTPLLGENGDHIFFHEYINPFKESDKLLERYNSTLSIPENLTLNVHGIDLDFLEGKSGLVTRSGSRNETKLSRPAPTFSEIKPYIESLLDTHNLIEHSGGVYFIAHNALFDIKFMSAEWIRCEMFEEKEKYPASFESYINIIDTLGILRMLYTSNELAVESQARGIKTKSGFNLDFLQEFYGIKIERDMHGALLDSKILEQVYNSIITDNKHRDSKKISKNKDIKYTRPNQSLKGLVKI